MERPCRCLLRDVFPQDYDKYVRGVLDSMPADRLAPETLREQRLAACRECDQLNNGTCMGCGCLVEVKAAMKDERCPYAHWTRSGVSGAQ